MQTPSSDVWDDPIDNVENPFEIIRQIKDPIHGYIHISRQLSLFIDTRQFQRLRNIKQLGTSSYVWPSACHTRFEHSLGVAHLARMMAQHLKDKQPDLGITDRDVHCVEVAGLCHDLGHGPWSHVWDGMFIPEALKQNPEQLGHLRQWTHEKGSEMLFDALIEESEVQISSKDKDFIKALIAGEQSRTPDEKPFLFDIVANKRNGLDVDKFDYIHRDSHTVGEPICLSLTRLVNSARVLEDQICYDIKDANHIYEICNARFKLHKIFYNHKSAKAIEYMIIDALLLAEPYMNLVRRINNPNTYLYLTDSILETIEASESEELQPARDIIKRIRTRDLYKCVEYKTIDWPDREMFLKHITAAKIVEAANAIAAEEGKDVHIKETDVIVDSSTMHYGMKEKNPLDSVKFYSKRSPDVCHHADRGDYSTLMPSYFAEVLLRIFSKDKNVQCLVQDGYRRVVKDLLDGIAMGTIQPSEQRECNSTCSCSCHVHAISQAVPTMLVSRDPDELPGIGITPPASEAPSTPKATHSRLGSFSFPSMGGGSASASTPMFNKFMTMTNDGVPGSPSASAARNRKPRSLQRGGNRSSNSSLDSITDVEVESGRGASRTMSTVSGGSVGMSEGGGSGGVKGSKKRDRGQVDESAEDDVLGVERETKKHRLELGIEG